MKTLVIYNPNAGQKRRLVQKTKFGPEELKLLLEKYQIPADIKETKKAGDGTMLARQAVKAKYDMVIAAGGDGTLSEAAIGLVKTNKILGVIPLGTFMNMARMLAVPNEIEKAVELIKIGRTRKIDAGKIITMGGKKLDTPTYFFENCGIGMEAELQESFARLEKGDVRQIFTVFKTIFDFYARKTRLELDGKIITRQASLVEVSNGAETGAALKMAPGAKLNDHRLTVSIFKMEKWDLLRFLLHMLRGNPARSAAIERYRVERVKIFPQHKQMVHADARVFGTTPVEIEILPEGLTVITGFPDPTKEANLEPKTPLDPGGTAGSGKGRLANKKTRLSPTVKKYRKKKPSGT